MAADMVDTARLRLDRPGSVWFRERWQPTETPARVVVTRFADRGPGLCGLEHGVEGCSAEDVSLSRDDDFVAGGFSRGSALSPYEVVEGKVSRVRPEVVPGLEEVLCGLPGPLAAELVSSYYHGIDARSRACTCPVFLDRVDRAARRPGRRYEGKNSSNCVGFVDFLCDEVLKMVRVLAWLICDLRVSFVWVRSCVLTSALLVGSYVVGPWCAWARSRTVRAVARCPL